MLIRLKKRLKYCPRCKRTRQRRSFIHNRARHDGLSTYCKTCHVKYYALSMKSDAALERAERWKKKYPEKFKATQLASALRRRSDNCRMTMQDVLNDFKNYTHCPYCKITLTWRNFSYDHLDGRASEVHGVCVECNLLKNQFHHSDFLTICNALGQERLRWYTERVRRPYGVYAPSKVILRERRSEVSKQ